MPAPSAPLRQSNTTGCGGCTGVRAVFTIWRMLKTVSPSSPNSNTNRDWSPSTTHARLGGPARASRSSAARFAVSGSVATSTTRMPPARRNRELLRLEPLAVDRGDALTRVPGGRPVNSARPASLVDAVESAVAPRSARTGARRRSPARRGRREPSRCRAAHRRPAAACRTSVSGPASCPADAQGSAPTTASAAQKRHRDPTIEGSCRFTRRIRELRAATLAECRIRVVAVPHDAADARRPDEPLAGCGAAVAQRDARCSSRSITAR